MLKRKCVFASGDILFVGPCAGSGPILGMVGTTPLSIPMCGLNLQYGATQYAGVDIATRKNAISGCPS
jgi:hypothetical protein